MLIVYVMNLISRQGFPSIHKPSPGEIRQIHIDKTCEQLGIKIEEGPPGGQGGVFVSSVSTNSLASQAGLQVSQDSALTVLITFPSDKNQW